MRLELEKKLTLDFDDTLNKFCELSFSQGVDPRLLAIIKQFGAFTIVTHRNFYTSTQSAIRAIEVLGGSSGRGRMNANEANVRVLPITKETLGGYFLPPFIRKLKGHYPEIDIQVCAEGTARDGFGELYTEQLLQFEEELISTLLSLNDHIYKKFPLFKHNLRLLVKDASSAVDKSEDFLKNSDQTFEPLLGSHDVPDLACFLKVVDVYINEKEKQIQRMAQQLLEALPKFLKTQGQTSATLAEKIEANFELFADESNLRDVETLVRLQLKQKLISKYESHFDNGFTKSNRDKRTQFEYLLSREGFGSSELFHVDDSKAVSRLEMDRVTVFRYEPAAIEDGKFVEDYSAHAWFVDFCKGLAKTNPGKATKIMLQGQSVVQLRGLTPEGEEGVLSLMAGYPDEERRNSYQGKFAMIIESLKDSSKDRQLLKNCRLYRMFIQEVDSFWDSLSCNLTFNDQHSNDRLRKEHAFCEFITSYQDITGRSDEKNELLKLFTEMHTLTKCGIMQAVNAQFPEINFDDVRAWLLEDLVRFTFIPPAEHQSYEMKGEYNSTHRRKINTVIARFFQKTEKTPEAFCLELDNLLNGFVEVNEGFLQALAGAGSEGEALRIIDAALKENANLNAIDDNGCGALHIVSKNKKLEGVTFRVVHRLVESGAMIDAVDGSGKTALHYLVRHHQNTQAVVYLIDQGADVNVQDMNGNTPLHIASMCIKLGMVKVLRSLEALKFLPNSDGKTPYSIAGEGCDERDCRLYSNDIGLIKEELYPLAKEYQRKEIDRGAMSAPILENQNHPILMPAPNESRKDFAQIATEASDEPDFHRLYNK